MKYIDLTPVQAWLHQGTTILGLAVLGGAVSSVLLNAATPRQAAAAAITGIISIAMKQVNSGTTNVTGPMPTVTAETVTVAPPAGSQTTICPGAPGQTVVKPSAAPIADALG